MTAIITPRAHAQQGSSDRSYPSAGGNWKSRKAGTGTGTETGTGTGTENGQGRQVDVATTAVS